MANKKKRTAKKKVESHQEINVNLSDLMRVGMKLMPQLIPIAKQIADDLNQGKPLLSEGSHTLFEVKKRTPVKKKRVPKIHKNFKNMYLCNQAVKPSKDRMAREWKKVTCENCLKQKK